MSAEVRQLASGDKISAELLRDFIWEALRHDAIRDELTELVVARTQGGLAEPVSAKLPQLIGELLDAAISDDWQAMADQLIQEAHETGGGEGL